MAPPHQGFVDTLVLMLDRQRRLMTSSLVMTKIMGKARARPIFPQPLRALASAGSLMNVAGMSRVNVMHSKLKSETRRGKRESNRLSGAVGMAWIAYDLRLCDNDGYDSYSKTHLRADFETKGPSPSLAEVGLASLV